MAVHALRKVQFGKETTWDTAVAATAKMMALNDGEISFSRTLYRPEFLGDLGPSNTVALVATEWSGSLDLDGTYEDLPYYLDGLFGTASPAGTAAPYTYSYNGPTSAVPTSPRLFSIEYGTASGSYVASGGLLTGLAIDISQGQPWKIAPEFKGGTLVAVSLASLSNRTVNLINTADTTVFVDVHTSGTIGSTAVTGSVISANVAFSTERHLKRFVGDTVPSDWGESKFDYTLDLVMEFNTTSKAYFDAMLTSSLSKLVRLKATSGTLVAQLDLAGALDGDISLWDERDGNSTISFSLIGHYDDTNTIWFEGEVQNAVSALA